MEQNELFLRHASSKPRQTTSNPKIEQEAQCKYLLVLTSSRTHSTETVNMNIKCSERSALNINIANM